MDQPTVARSAHAEYADRFPDPAMRRAAVRWLGLMVALVIVCVVLVEAGPAGAMPM